MRGRLFNEMILSTYIVKNNLWNSLTAKIGFSPCDTDPNCAACLRIHSHSRAESQVLPLHVTRAGFFHTRIIVNTGVHLGRGQSVSPWGPTVCGSSLWELGYLAVAVSESAVPDDLTLPHRPSFAVWV